MLRGLQILIGIVRGGGEVMIVGRWGENSAGARHDQDVSRKRHRSHGPSFFLSHIIDFC